jgi:mannose-6-phosphate isomerase-like protein (cupin superfamily)
MYAFGVGELVEQRLKADKAYMEFMRVPDLSMGLYVLPAGGIDPQSPHSEDEVYYVLSGTGKIQVGDEERQVGAGSIVYVPKNTEHHFYSIKEELRILVFFAAAESSNQQ